MRVLRDPPPGCRGLVAVNGFDCFTACDDFPGTAPRVADRMIARFDHAPEAVLADFRRRCGADAPSTALRPEPLRRDLLALNCRDDSAGWNLPILSLQGANDLILPPQMRGKAFASAPHAQRATHQTAAHLLLLTDAAYCAGIVREFVESVA
jgi:pimeloyl-[acyl-carrier protein] methyl ester esterase